MRITVGHSADPQTSSAMGGCLPDGTVTLRSGGPDSLSFPWEHPGGGNASYWRDGPAFSRSEAVLLGRDAVFVTDRARADLDFAPAGTLADAGRAAVG